MSHQTYVWPGPGPRGANTFADAIVSQPGSREKYWRTKQVEG